MPTDSAPPRPCPFSGNSRALGVSPIQAYYRSVDTRGRALRDLRLSVTDRCDFRCNYCMPEATYTWLPRDDILSFEELELVVRAFADAGVTKVRLTGGEPLLRRDLAVLVARIAADPRITDISLTTNGVHLVDQAAALRAAGLHRVTVSLDTKRADRHEAITRRANHQGVLDGISAIGAAGLSGTKINTVVIRGTNDDELIDLLEYGSSVGAEVRFIEYMDVGGATGWTCDAVVTSDEMLTRLGAAYGPITPAEARLAAPARRYQLPDGRVFGIVASTSEPFCSTCDRSRVTADGMWFRCLYAATGTDLRALVRGGADRAELRNTIEQQWRNRSDQGAVDRLSAPRRVAAVPVELLRRDPHLEMHTRGG